MKVQAALFGLVLLAIACSQKPTQDSANSPAASVDSTDSTIAEYSDDEAYSEDSEYADESETSRDSLAQAITEAVDETEEERKNASVFSLSGTFKGYENSTDASYYFDNNLTLTYCDVSWSMEGTSGKFMYLFDGDDLVGGHEDNYYNDFEEYVTLHSKFNPTFGFSKTNGAEDDSYINLIGEADFLSRKSDANTQFQRLVSRIKEYQDSVTIDGEFFVLRLENVVNYGEDFTETEEYKISKRVFDKLIKD
jgi:hypothetical protein